MEEQQLVVGFSMKSTKFLLIDIRTLRELRGERKFQL
jgi:hypothetical protein